MTMTRTRKTIWPILSQAALVFALALPTGALARDPDRTSNADKAAENAARAEERAARDAIKERGDRREIETRLVEERAKADTRAARDMADLAADKQSDADKQASDVAKDIEDAAEQARKDAEDAAKDAVDAAEKAAKEAEDAAEDAAKDAQDAVEDALKGESSGSGSMRNLAAEEKPEFDDRGFPARRGEIVALDMSEAALMSAKGKGFVLIETARMPSLDATIIRLKVPKDMPAGEALSLMRSIDSKGSYDLTHYYGLNVGTAGTADGGVLKPLPRKHGRLRIGMIDTAVSAHPSLKGVRMDARNFAGTGGVMPTAHGTAIASLLASEGSSTILSAGVFKGNGATPFTSADALGKALEWLVSNDVNVINISLAGPRNTILDALIRRSIRSGHAIVAAAGNGGPSAPPAYPAAVPGVIAVTAVDSNQRVYRYANQGPYIAFAARGVGVPAAAPGGSVSGHSGTSFATPFVATHLARCLTGQATTTTCIRSMERSARDLGAPGRDPVYGYGVIQN